MGKSYTFHSLYIKFIGFTIGIPRYNTMDRQNYIGFTVYVKTLQPLFSNYSTLCSLYRVGSCGVGRVIDM